MPALSQGLRLLLLHEPGTADAVEGIVANPALHAEVKAALPALIAAREAAMQPTDIEGLARVIADRFANYPQPSRTEEEWASWWRGYHDALSDVPKANIEAAMKAWVRSPERFLPNPGQLRELALKQTLPEYTAAYRAKLAVAQEPRRISKPDVETRRRQVAELLAGIGSKPAGAA
jgi:hypothetical protein